MVERDPLIAATLESDNISEQSIDRSLRPLQLNEFVGQPKLREQVEIFIQAARNRGDALDHVLGVEHLTFSRALGDADSDLAVQDGC